MHAGIFSWLNESLNVWVSTVENYMHEIKGEMALMKYLEGLLFPEEKVKSDKKRLNTNSSQICTSFLQSKRRFLQSQPQFLVFDKLMSQIQLRPGLTEHKLTIYLHTPRKITYNAQ